MFKKTLLALSAAAAALVSTGVLADPPHWAPAHGYRAKHYYKHHDKHHHGHYYYAPRPVVVVPAPRVVYAPPPPVVYPYYAAPVVVPAPAYYGAPSLSIRFNIPL